MKKLFLTITLIILTCSVVFSATWPQTKIEGTVPISIGKFEFNVPEQWQGADIFNNWTHRINYDGYSITIALNQPNKISVPLEIYEKSNFSEADFPYLMMKKNDNNLKTENEYDIQILKEAETVREIWFDENNSKFYENGALMAYSGSTDFEGITNCTGLAVKNEPYIIQILHRNTPENIILNIISSFKLREGF